MELNNLKVVVTGGSGFLGRNICQKLTEQKVKLYSVSSRDGDLRDRGQCQKMISALKPDIIIHAAGKVGGIGLNKDKPYTLWSDNLRMGLNILDTAITSRVSKVVIIGTICEYPKFTPVPFREEDLHNGYPEETNAPYGYAKRAILVGGQAARAQFGANIIHLLPVNLYGPGDNFDPESSHVIPALIRKVAEAKIMGHKHIEVWGTGKPTREFLYVEDAAEAIVLAAEKYDKPEPINLGSGRELSIETLAQNICNLMDFRGEIRWLSDKPDGQPRRMLDISRAEREFGFRARTEFIRGLQKTIDWFRWHREYQSQSYPLSFSQ